VPGNFMENGKLNHEVQLQNSDIREIQDVINNEALPECTYLDSDLDEEIVNDTNTLERNDNNENNNKNVIYDNDDNDDDNDNDDVQLVAQCDADYDHHDTEPMELICLDKISASQIRLASRQSEDRLQVYSEISNLLDQEPLSLIEDSFEEFLVCLLNDSQSSDPKVMEGSRQICKKLPLSIPPFLCLEVLSKIFVRPSFGLSSDSAIEQGLLLYNKFMSLLPQQDVLKAVKLIISVLPQFLYSSNPGLRKAVVDVLLVCQGVSKEELFVVEVLSHFSPLQQRLVNAWISHKSNKPRA